MASDDSRVGGKTVNTAAREWPAEPLQPRARTQPEQTGGAALIGCRRQPIAARLSRANSCSVLLPRHPLNRRDIQTMTMVN